MMPVPQSTEVQRLSESSVARLIYSMFIGNKTSSSVIVPSTKQGPSSDRVKRSRRQKLSPTLHGFQLANALV